MEVEITTENFEQSQKLLFSGPFVIQIIGIGMIIPICEELIYRGLIFMRMRQYCNVNLAIGLSALLFAAFHGNVVQGIYGFATGVLFAYVCEKFRKNDTDHAACEASFGKRNPNGGY